MAPGAVSLATVARGLRGEVSGGQVLCPGPGHSPADRSLSVKFDAKAPEGFIVQSFAGDDAIVCRDHVRNRLGWPEWKPGTGRKGGRGWSEFIYRDAAGQNYLRVAKTPDKGFPQSHWTGSAWAKGKPQGPKIPYRLPELLASDPAAPVFVCEGEKDADNLARRGFTATTNSEGAGCWTEALNPHFVGRTVFILADNDDAGADHAVKVARHLAPIAAEVRIVNLPDLPDKGDVSNWLEAGGDVASLPAVCRGFPVFGSEGEIGSEAESPGDAPKSRSPLLTWFGATAPASPRWLVNGILPEKGVAILAGQHGAGKTFVALDLAAAVVTGGEFAEAQVRRQGGVLFLAAEGEGEVDGRMLAIINGKLNPPKPAPGVSEWLSSHDGKPKGWAGLHSKVPSPSPWPFARQVRDVPRLTEKDALPRLRAFTTAAASEMATYFDGAPLALIVLDTLSAAAGFEDENSSSETQRVMNMLGALSRETGALVLVVDHFGKAAETGVRGSSAKGASADAILAVLAERSATGTVSDRRMAVTKLRGGVTGAVRSFELRETAIDEWGASNCFVQWAAPKDTAEAEEGEVRAEADTGRALLRAIYDKPAGSHAEWAAAIGKSKGLIGKKLTVLKAEKLVDRVLDTWSLTPKGQIEALRRA